MKRGTEAARVLAAHKELILEALEERGPATVAELPRSWPVTRAVVAALVDELELEGAITPVAMMRTTRAVVWGLTPEAWRAEPLPLAS